LVVLAAGTFSLAVCGTANALVLGVNVHPEEPETLQAGAYNPTDYTKVLDEMQAAGAQMVRVFVPWIWIEPNGPGQYDQSYLATMDSYVQAVRAHGMKLLMVLVGTPCWATSDPSSVCVDGQYGADDSGATYPPTADSAAGTIAAFIVNRWDPDALEVWNEPDLPQYFTPAPGEDTALAYTDLDKAVYSAVKAASPSTTVVAGAISQGDTTFLQDLYNDGIGQYSDAISVHPYNIEFSDPFEYWGDPLTAFPDNPEASFITAVPAIHQVMVANGDANKPLWITEFGFSACNPSYLCLDEETQAQYLKESIGAIESWPYVQVALVDEAWDSSGDYNSWNGFGLLRNDFTRRPA
jgi:polysaccharide biosynthesis protein PslG